MTFLDSISRGADPGNCLSRKEHNVVKRTRQVAKFVSLDAAQNSKEWLSRRGPPDRDGVALYLSLFGYKAFNESRWAPTCATWPLVEISIMTHAEINNHTWYLIKCAVSLDSGTERLEWHTARRLCHLRQFWYEHVKREFGQEYHRHFAASPFAHHGAVVGTSARLNAWCKSLVVTLNRGIASPYVAALTLKVLDAPHLHALDNCLRAADIGVDDRMVQAIEEQVDSFKIVASPLSEIDSMDLFQIDVEFQDSELDATIQDSKAFCITRPDFEKEGATAEPKDLQDDGAVAEEIVEYLRTIANNGPMPVVDESMKNNGDDFSMAVLSEGDLSSPGRAIYESGLEPVKLGFLPIIEEESTDLSMLTSTAQSLDDHSSTSVMEIDMDLNRQAPTHL